MTLLLRLLGSLGAVRADVELLLLLLDVERPGLQCLLLQLQSHEVRQRGRKVRRLHAYCNRRAEIGHGQPFE